MRRIVFQLALEMRGDPSECTDTVHRVLDAGVFQDALAEYAADLGKRAAVESILIVFRDPQR